MSPEIPPRTYPSSTTDHVYANATSAPDAPKPGAPTRENTPQAHYRDDAPHLNYAQIEFERNPGGARRFQIKEAAVRHHQAKTDYSTVDAIKTARLEAAPHALFHAREQLADEIRALVKAFATPNRAGILKKIRGDKEAYGAGASAATLAQGLVAGNFSGCADALLAASDDMRQRTPKESYQFVDRIVTALTMDALKGLTLAQTEVVGRHVRNASLEEALSRVEPDRTTMAASIARDSVVKAMMAAHGAPEAAR